MSFTKSLNKVYVDCQRIGQYLQFHKLLKWPILSSKEFLKQLDKQKVKLSLPEQAEWMQYFETEKIKSNEIQLVINTTDKEIDDMVYNLYGLTEEERRTVEE